MVGIRFADLRSHPTEFLDFISVTLDEFPQLVPPFEAVFQARMAAWRMCTCSHETLLVNSLGHRPTVSQLLTPVASRNVLLYQSLPTSVRYRHANWWRRNDDTGVGTAERRIVKRLYR